MLQVVEQPTTKETHMRATFDLRITGSPSATEDAIERLGDSLLERGFIFDDDWTQLDPSVGVGVRIHSLNALKAVIEELRDLGLYMVETDRASV